jgi:hypothetical protein
MYLSFTDQDVETALQALMIAAPTNPGALELIEKINQHKNKNKYDDQFIDAANEQYAEDGSIEIYQDTIVSQENDGAYVMAWVYVTNSEAKIPLYATWMEAAIAQGWRQIDVNDPKTATHDIVAPALYNDQLDRVFTSDDWKGAAKDVGIKDHEVEETLE